jgi:hypothetical protein
MDEIDITVYRTPVIKLILLYTDCYIMDRTCLILNRWSFRYNLRKKKRTRNVIFCDTIHYRSFVYFLLLYHINNELCIIYNICQFSNKRIWNMTWYDSNMNKLRFRYTYLIAELCFFNKNVDININAQL